jgi:hypothetical protein
MALQDRSYHQDKSFTERSLSKENEADDLEKQWISTQVDMAASKVDELVRKYSDKPEFLNKVLSRLIDERLPKRSETYTDYE